NPPVSLRVWEWLGMAVFAAVAWSFMKGFRISAGLDRRRLERLLLGIQVALGAIALTVPEIWAFSALIVWAVAIVGLGAYVLLLVVRVSRNRKVDHPYLLSVAAAVAAL